MARQVGLVIGTSAMVGLLGSGIPSLARFQHVWAFIAATSVAAAIAALVMDGVRSRAVELVTASGPCSRRM